MPTGPGKYEPECTEMLEKTGADAVLLIVLGGEKGSGFSMGTFKPANILLVPTLLRDIADAIEKCGGHA